MVAGVESEVAAVVSASLLTLISLSDVVEVGNCEEDDLNTVEVSSNANGRELAGGDDPVGTNSRLD